MKADGVGTRKNPSWIDTFVDYTEGLEAPLIFRKWAAITMIGAVLEQKVWMMSPTILYPNLYTFLVAHPGVGKTKSVRAVRNYYVQLDKHALAPNSFTAAALVDALIGYKRVITRMPEEALEYNSTWVAADEMGTFLHKWDDEMGANLSAFYDPDEYGHHRRGAEIRIKIKRPQVSMLVGSTPSNLMKVLPESAWSQGFMSRVILIWSDERFITNIFETKEIGIDKGLMDDLRLINKLVGQCVMTQDYSKAVMNWRYAELSPVPQHPRMAHYNTRRLAQLLKLTIISSADRGPSMVLTVDDFNRAMGWLLEAESMAPYIFVAAGAGPDSNAINDLYSFIANADKGAGVHERVVTNYARELLPIRMINDALRIMGQAGLVEIKSRDQYGCAIYRAIPKK